MSSIGPGVERILQYFDSKQGKKTLIVAVIAASLLVTSFIYAKKTVHIAVDGQTLQVVTFYGDPQRVLKQASIQLSPQDEYRLSTPKLTEGSVIEVFRAVPVFVSYQGKNAKVQTAKPTVEETVMLLGLAGPGWKLVPERNARISPGMQIQAIQVVELIEENEEPVEYQTVRQPDPALESGQEEVLQEGRPGLKKVTVKKRLEDGNEVSSEILHEEIVTPATDRILRAGSRDMVETSRGALRFKRMMIMEATAYLPTDGPGHGITASGVPARRGVVAVDPGVIPLGSRVFIPGYGVALAADTGGAIIGDKIDLCMEAAAEAWQFGRRDVKVYVLDD
ncbi:G5 domain-containing protein [Acetonema longum]|uniref:3D domain protein n=1 Tax=Acetonema longum DSM 6540 TaxID=1009370 RepID=F7NFR9_9FIRM|nr:G5 domain-containing protein [Acetonema longum]EGO65132.1 3D domain protein [Acetonema longum DSM 6540]